MEAARFRNSREWEYLGVDCLMAANPSMDCGQTGNEPLLLPRGRPVRVSDLPLPRCLSLGQPIHLLATAFACSVKISSDLLTPRRVGLFTVPRMVFFAIGSPLLRAASR
ncbi:hypothetical protein OJAV_G00220870 [Oryzias javanicus]|uniref:Uncharacterized protein n=1 Tax=Oryzias javanicus TaxID=123683 RepID=A0A437C110_ORYJA|nr:hypothetical protein OJAV_G00220870 [Oryzias javanicus]